MAKVKAPHTHPAKAEPKNTAAPVESEHATIAPPVASASASPAIVSAPSSLSSADGEPGALAALWDRFCAEASFSAESLESEASVIRDEIAGLQARIAERQAELDEITHRETTARDKMTALLKVGFSAEAIISAMKVEFRAKKGPARVKEKEVEVGDDEKITVLDVLDREGQPLAEVARHVGRDAKEVQRVLLALVAEGRVSTQGERRSKLFMLV